VHKLGKIKNITNDGNLLVEAITAPRNGTEVYSERNQLLGRIGSVIGPVEAPYLIVRPQRGKNLHSHVGKDAFMR